MSRRNYVKDNVSLSGFGALVAQLESIVASASLQNPDPLLCFDLLSDLIAAIDEEPNVSLLTLLFHLPNSPVELCMLFESILLWRRKCHLFYCGSLFIACAWHTETCATFGFSCHDENNHER